MMIEDHPGRSFGDGWIPRLLRAGRHQCAIDSEWRRPVPVVGERAVWSKEKPGRPRRFLFWQAEDQPPARKGPFGRTIWLVKVFEGLPDQAKLVPGDLMGTPLGVREFKTEDEAAAAARKVLKNYAGA